MIKLFDIHCHLQDLKLADDLDICIKEAVKAGVAGFLSCGTSEQDWPQLEFIAGKYSEIIPAFGLHPWYVNTRSPECFEILENYLKKYPYAIGEIGLDHALKDADKALQENIFIYQLNLAEKYKLPVSVHCRRAWDRLVPVLKEFNPLKNSVNILVHSFSGSLQVMETLIDLRIFFSFSGALTYNNNKKAYKAALHVPLDNLLIETDSPDMVPFIPDYEAEINKPSNLLYVLNKIADIKGIPPCELAKITYNNAVKFLGELKLTRHYE